MRTLVTAMVALSFASGGLRAQAAIEEATAGVAAFNRALDDATRRMDNAATLALWADDGASFFPQAAPVKGKKAIAKFLDDVMAGIAGARMEKFEMACFDIAIDGATATEWCNEHQVVQLPEARRFEGWGRMLLVLHRGADGKWRMRREMWQQAPVPTTAAPPPP
jgi:ketosteroid isomerase-like protein